MFAGIFSPSFRPLIPRIFPSLFRGPDLRTRPFQTGLIVLLFLLGGCATDSSKPSPVSIETDRVRQALVSITESYEKKDEKTFFSKVDPDFKSPAGFRSQVLRDFNTFSEADIRMIIDRIQIEQGSILVAVHWGGSWKLLPGAPPIEKKGHTLFRWTSGEELRLVEIKGDPPFGIFPEGA